MKSSKILFTGCVLGLSLTVIHSAEPSSDRVIRDPLGVNTNALQSLLQNAREQREMSKNYRVDFNFEFVDRLPESGITFRNKVVDDASKSWRAAHYDHGCGVAVADVDGDGLEDIYFSNQVGRNGLWRNLGGGRFEDITDRAGVALEDGINVAAAFGDLDNDGKPDLVVTGVRTGNVVFKNLGGGKFQDVTSGSGFEHFGHSSGIVFFDYDRDGRLDIYVTSVGVYTSEEQAVDGSYRGLEDAFHGHLFPERAELGLLYHNDGDFKFSEVSKQLGLQDRSWSGDASFSDVNGDGWPDLYVLSMQGDDQLYINEGGKRFVEQTARYFPKTSWGAMGIKFFDFDNDGRLDLMTTDMHSDMTESQSDKGKTDYSVEFEKRKSDQWCTIEWTDAFLINSANNIFGNSLYRNTGEGIYAEVSDAMNAETYWPWGISVADLNADGYEDVFVSGGMGYPFRYGINSLLLNEQGLRFVDAEYLTNIEPRRDHEVEGPWFTIDANGADRGHLLAKRRNGTWTVFGSLTSRSAAAFDLDHDGDLDLVTNEQNGVPLVLINNRSETGPLNYLKLKLVGTKSNRDGIGAVVRLRAGGALQTRNHDAKSGYLSLSSLPLYFGLGEADKVDQIEILWPSGIHQVINDGVKINQLMTINEPAE